MTDVALAILAKAPLPGLAKTRLIPALGAQGAANLQAWLIARCVATACAAARGPIRIAPITLWCAPDTLHETFVRLRGDHDIELATQPEGDIGARMLAACRHTPGTATLVIGTDVPALTAEVIQQAARCLRYGADAVLAPAEDGGYVLIGMREPDIRVFAGVDWGTGQVLTQTRTRFEAAGWRWTELETLWDIDTPADYTRIATLHPELKDIVTANPCQFGQST